MDKRAWIIFVVAVVAIFAGLVAFSKQNSIDVSSFNHAKPLTNKSDKPTPKINDHVYGNKDSEVVLIEYGDFQCPGCGNLHKTMQPITEVYKNQIAFVFRNFPISTLHPNARAAAAAAEAAGLQDRYWDMNNFLFNNQRDWSSLSASERDDMFAAYAKRLGIDTEQFRKDFASEKVSNKINFDLALGKANGVNATPTLFLNGEKLEPEDYKDMNAFRETLDKALAEAKDSTKKEDK